MSDDQIDALLGREPIQLSADERFWKLPDVTARVGLSKSEIYRRIREGTFPKSRRYQGRIGVFWCASEIGRWQRQEIDGPDQQW